MLKNPKPGFEEVIKLHFKHRKVPLLKTLHGWVEEVATHSLCTTTQFAASYATGVLA